MIISITKSRYVIRTLVLFCCCLVLAGQLRGQEKEEAEALGAHHQITLVMGHAHIPEGISENGGKAWIVRAAWGLDYDYWFNKKWGIGLHNDVILEDFQVRKSFSEQEEVIKRTTPVASCITGSFRPGKHIACSVGVGGEFAKEGNYWLIRPGIDYGWELPGSWELSAVFSFDIKINAYNSFLLGIGVSKIIPAGHKTKKTKE